MSRGPAYILGVYVHRTDLISLRSGSPSPQPPVPVLAAAAIDVSAKPAASSHPTQGEKIAPRQ